MKNLFGLLFTTFPLLKTQPILPLLPYICMALSLSNGLLVCPTGAGARLHAKTLVFVQSSGMGKSRLADAFGESCLMINYILCPPGDQEILQFMLSKPPHEVLNASPSEKQAAGVDDSRGDSANPSLIVVCDEASNLLSPGIADFDTGRYVALNCVLNCLKELPTRLFMLSTYSRVGKLLPPDIQAKVAEKEKEDRLWSNPSGRMPPPSTMNQWKQLNLFPLFVSFWLDFEDRKRMSEPESRGKEFSKPLAGFSEPTHMSMFGRPLWLAHGGSDKLEEVPKWKLLGGRRHTKYDPDNKHYVLVAVSSRVALDVYLEKSSISSSRSNGSQLSLEGGCFYGLKYRCITYSNPLRT